jgi:hypothetical protein
MCCFASIARAVVCRSCRTLAVMVESKSHAQRPVRRWRTACPAAQSLRVAGGRNVQAWRSVLRRPAHWRASAAGAAPRSRWAVRPLAASAPQCSGQQRNASACAVCGAPQRTSIRHCTHLAVCPGPASTQRLRCICCFATAGIGHAAHAGGCFGRARRVRTAAERRGVANAVPFAQAWRAMTANPSIERTSKRLRLFAAAHVERYVAQDAPGLHTRFLVATLKRALRVRSSERQTQPRQSWLDSRVRQATGLG